MSDPIPIFGEDIEQCDACGKIVPAGAGHLGFECYYCNECWKGRQE